MFISLTEFCCSPPTAGFSPEWISSFSLCSCKLSQYCPFYELVGILMLLWSLAMSLLSLSSNRQDNWKASITAHGSVIHWESTPFNQSNVHIFPSVRKRRMVILLISMAELRGIFVLAWCKFYLDQQQLSDFLLIFDILVILNFYNWVYIHFINSKPPQFCSWE